MNEDITNDDCPTEDDVLTFKMKTWCKCSVCGIKVLAKVSLCSECVQELEAEMD